MTVVVPNALALTTIVDGSSIVASDHRNNYAAIQVAENGLIAMFAVAPTKGDLIVSAGGGSFDRLGVGANGQTIVADSTQPLGVKWAAAAGITYRKSTAKTVVNSIAETDLLNAEITIAAGVMGTTGVARLTAWGDWKQNSGAATDMPRFKLKLGATTLFDSGITGVNSAANSASRFGWRFVAEIMNLGAANAQWATLDGKVLGGVGTTFSPTAFTTGEADILPIMASISQYTGAIYLGGNSAAVDTTAGQTLVLSVILPVANAATDIVLKGALIEVI